MTEAASMPTTASMDRENDTLLTHMRAFFDKIRISGINCGPSCFQSENFPSENCTVGDIVAWLQLAILTLIPYIITAEKNKRYRFGSKSERAIINQRNGFVKEANNKLEEHKKNNNTIYRSDYEKVTSDIKQELDKLNQTLLELAERSLNQNRQVDKCRKTIERLEELLKGYEKMTVIDDPEESSETPMSSETGSHTCDGTSDSPDQSDASSTSDDPDASGTSDNPDASSTSDDPDASGTSDNPDASSTSDAPDASRTSDAPDASGTSDASDASGTSDNSGTSGTSDNPCNPKCNLFPVELEEKIPNSKEIDEEVQIIANNKEQKKNLSLENKMQEFNEIYLANKCNNLGYKNAKVCIINKVNAVDPITRTIISVNKAAYRSRTFEVLHENSKLIEKIMSETTLFRGKNGEEFELNPAANSELCLVDEDGNAIAMLDSQLLLNPDSPEHEALKNELNAQWQYDQSLLNVLTVENYRLLLSPIEFLGNPSLIYGMRPVFMRIGMSEELAIHLTVDAIMLLTSKGRITSKEDIINCGEFFSRQHVIEIINGLARVFNPLAELIREISLSIVITISPNFVNSDEHCECFTLLPF